MRVAWRSRQLRLLWACTVNRAHMAYAHGGIEALKPKQNGGRIIRT